ncbi:hypothetical protein DFJ73DRAFT_799495 [Zopfochytrium polystomum]|nr:hypothetical protein DFJ73DRAFT_799495 [Zopfochytrium polystomum]
MGSIVGGLLTFGIGHIRGPLPAWKSINLMLEAITVLWRIILFRPDRVIATQRFSIDEKATLTGYTRLGPDPLALLFMLLNATINGGISNFGKLIIKGVVSDPLKTVLLGLPFGVVGSVWILTGSYTAYCFKNVNTIIMPLYLIPTVIDTLKMWLVDRKSHCGDAGCQPRRLHEADEGTAAVFLAACVGNIVSPHAFLAEEASTYPTGCKVILWCCAGQVVLAMLLRWLT